MFQRLSGLLALLSWAIPFAASAQGQGRTVVPLTFEDAVAEARAHAPALASGQAAVTVSVAEVGAAAVWRSNPTVGVSAGPRVGSDGTSADMSVEVGQAVPLAPQRRLRVDVAGAQRVVASAALEEMERQVLTAVAIEFADLLYWKHRRKLAEQSLALADEIRRVATQRHAAGDVGGLDETIASLGQATADSNLARVNAEALANQGRLRVLLGRTDDREVEPVGDLATFLQASSAASGERSDVEQLGARLQAARAMERLARANRWPELHVGLEYAREEQADIVLGILSVSLPLFDRGQGQASVAAAWAEKIELERDALQARATTEASTAARTVALLEAAVGKFSADGLSTLKRAEEGAAASYAAGAMPLSELLAVRRELTAANLEFAELQRALALARVDLRASLGNW